MATITIRDLPDVTKEKFRVHAAQLGVSLESHIRKILKEASKAEHSKPVSILGMAEKYFGSKNGIDIELPERISKRQPIDLNS